MSTYFTDDFADFSTCSGGSCGDWTQRIRTDRTGWTVSGGNLTQSDTPTTDWGYLSWNDIDGDSNRANVEVLIKYKTTSVITNFFFILRGGGADESATNYSVYVRSNALRVYQCNSTDSPTEVSSAAKTIAASTDYWIRFRLNGSGPTTVQARIWADGGSEPGTWDIDTTDTGGPTAAGWVGPSSYSSVSADGVYYQLGVGTNGDTAPASAGGGAVSVNLTGLATTGAVGSLGKQQSKALTGLAATGAVGTLSAARAVALSGLAASGQVGSLSLSRAKALAGLEASGAVGTISPSTAANVALSGLGATGDVGTPAAAHSITVNGLTAASAVGVLSPESAGAVSLAGLTATGAVGVLGVSASVDLTGFEVIGAVGSLGTAAGSTVALTGLEATGAVGNLSLEIAVDLSGLEAVGVVGSLGISTPTSVGLTGLGVTGAVGTFDFFTPAVIGGGAGYPYDYSELKRTKSTRESIKDIIEDLDEVADDMVEAVSGEVIGTVAPRPVDVSAIADRMTPRLSRQEPDDDDDDFLLLSF